MKILMVEDEKRLSEAVEQTLKTNNYSVDLAYDGEEGLAFALEGNYDCILLDVMMPKMDGIEVLRSIRGNGIITPVIMLTAKAEVDDKITGLENGADDYIPKPFAMQELLARIKAVSRRSNATEDAVDDNIRFGDLTYNPLGLYVSCMTSGIDGFELTLKEGQLLEYLMKNTHTTSPIDKIISDVWGWDSDADASNVHVYINFLKKKLKRLGSKVEIKNIRHAGYKLVEVEE